MPKRASGPQPAAKVPAGAARRRRSGPTSPEAKNGLRVLVANEPRSYREAIAAVLREVRPAARIFEADPSKIDREVARRRPDLVICSRATPAVRDMVAGWVELYPEHGPLSLVYVDGRLSEVEGMDLLALLSIVDRAGSPHPGRPALPTPGALA
ncbi:MAG TPA: hypothetical protein VKA73_02655 [Rubrobacter sp.]|nr:hypothetical protein [Rubrobacter sp.]